MTRTGGYAVWVFVSIQGCGGCPRVNPWLSSGRPQPCWGGVMFDMLFGEGYALKLLFAFIAVFGLLALALWLVRRFGGERLGNTTGRGRQPRLAVIDAANVDGRRRLVLIRRDNVEHLLIIGG